MTKFLQKTKHELAFIFVAFALFLGGFWLSGCAAMQDLYDENGNLKTETVEDIRAGASFVKGVTDTAAPNLSPVVVGGSAVVGGALALIGKAFFRRKNNGV